MGARMFGYYIDAFRRYADFKGCSTRAEFWWFALINFLIGLAYSIMFYFAVRSMFMDAVSSMLNEMIVDDELNVVMPQVVHPQISFAAVYARMRFWSILFVLYNLVVFIPSLAIFARRLHDGGHSAWHVLVCYLAPWGLIFSFFALPLFLIGLLAYDLTLLVWLCMPSKIKDNPYRRTDSGQGANEDAFVSREVEKTERMKAIDDFFKSPLK